MCTSSRRVLLNTPPCVGEVGDTSLLGPGEVGLEREFLLLGSRTTVFFRPSPNKPFFSSTTTGCTGGGGGEVAVGVDLKNPMLMAEYAVCTGYQCANGRKRRERIRTRTRML